MKRIILILVLADLLLTNCSTDKDNFIDSRDGKSYKTVTLGTQIWMAENLAYKENNGCWSYDNDINNVEKYGYLYNWETAKEACPTGWHLPTNEEWQTLIDYIGGEKDAGTKLKSTKCWDYSIPYASNSSGFSALPGGCYNALDENSPQVQLHKMFEGIGFSGRWWSATEVGDENAWTILLWYSLGNITSSTQEKKLGFSVRCIKDNLKSSKSKTTPKDTLEKKDTNINSTNNLK